MRGALLATFLVLVVVVLLVVVLVLVATLLKKVLRLFHFFREHDKILYEHTRDNSSSIDGFRFLNFAMKFENAAKIGSFSLQSA